MAESNLNINKSAKDSKKSTQFIKKSTQSWQKESQSKKTQLKESWFERNECAGSFWLNLTILLVRFLPKFALNIVIVVVTAIYYIFSKKERANLAKFYKVLQQYCKSHNIAMQNSVKNPKIYLNFYHFGWAICDKVAAWIGKIRYEHIDINHESIIKELCNTKGQILLMSHFGNTEVAYALSQKYRNLRIVIFVYQKNTEKFLQMIDKISERKIERVFVDDINIAKLLELREIIESGGHIGIMGDRVALNNKRNVAMDFLDKKCYFPCGAFIIAQLLETKISAMWCEKIKGKYRVEIENIGDLCDFPHSRDKIVALKPLLQKYVNLLQTHAINNPTQWFSFYDFWEEPSNDFGVDFKGDSNDDSDAKTNSNATTK